MKTYQKIFTAILSAVALFIAWACGVGVGQSNAGMNAEHSMLVRSVVILKEIDKGSPETAANWCKTFIVDSNRGRLSDDSVFGSFLHYVRYHNRPILTKSISDKVREVETTYKRNTVDLKGYSVKPTVVGFTVEGEFKAEVRR